MSRCCCCHAGQLPRWAAAEILIVGDDFPPFCYTDKAMKIDGLAYRALLMTFERAGEPYPMVRLMPWPRAHKLLQENPDAMTVAMTKTSERSDKFLWIGPYYQAPIYLYHLKSRAVQIDSEAQLKRYHYGVKRGGVDELFLRNAGVPDGQIDTVDEDIQNLRKLLLGRVDLVPFLPLEMSYYSHLVDLRSDEFAYAYSTGAGALHFAFNLNFSPERYLRLQAAFESVRSTPEFQQLPTQTYPVSAAFMVELGPPD